MNTWEEYFKGKKITMLGLGLLGRGVGDTAFLSECGAELIVTDLKSEEELKASVEHLEHYQNIEFILGEHRMEDFENRDLILVAAGVPLGSPYVKHAKEKGVECAMSAALFAKLSGIPIIGVTGTRGKSTVANMIHHVLTVSTGEEVLLGGNIRGASNLQLLKKVHKNSLAVMELDSWQLQGFGWAKISPQIAVFTNFMEDHMNYYQNNVDAYFADKANIFKYQEGDGTFIATPDVFERAKSLNISIASQVVLVDSSVLPDDYLLSMPGEHNRLNAALAYEALKAISLEDELIFEGLASFPGVPGRLQYVKEIDLPAQAGGVKIYNDNNATTPAATLAGLRALGGKTNVILIMGGADKGLDTSELLKEIPKWCKKVFLIPGTGTERLEKEVDDKNIYMKADSVEEAVHEAKNMAKNGDILLFSPGFASFGQYANEYERGDQFLDIVATL